MAPYGQPRRIAPFAARRLSTPRSALIVSKGYEQMSVQDVLDALDASRGAFYHYFDSKVALLEAVIERMVVEATARVERLLADPNVSGAGQAQPTAHRHAPITRTSGRISSAGFCRCGFQDDNVLVRDKLRRLTVARLTPLLAPIVRQGCAEGAFFGQLRRPEPRACSSHCCKR